MTLISLLVPQSAQATGTCGTGSWQSGTLEIHHINIGQGDSTLIVGPTGKSLLFDAGESNWNSSTRAQVIGPYIESVLGCKSLDYVLISHFHLDHIGYVGHGGLWNLVETQGFTVGTTFIRDYNAYLGDTSSTFTNWKTYLEGSGQATLHPAFAVEGTGQVNLGAGVAFQIVTVNGNGALITGNFSGDPNPPSENDYSIGVLISYGNFDEWIGGDVEGQLETSGYGYTYHDIELSVAPEVGDVDVYKVNHHASSHSSSATWVNQLDPEVSIVTVGNGNPYGHPTQSTMDRLLATSTVYMTERGDLNTNIGAAIVAGNIVIKISNGSAYTVNDTPFTATEPSRTDVDGDGYFAEADPNDGSALITPAPNGGCDPLYQTCAVSCQVTAGQVLINEFFPSPSNNGTEWIELYNTTGNPINIGYCYIDDIVGGSLPYQIPASTTISPHGFWTLDRNSYFNNTGDDVRFLKEDSNTILDSYTYGSTANDLSRYRLPDGGPWAASPTASTTKGQTNTFPFYPIVSSIVRADLNNTSASYINFTVTFSKSVTGVNTVAPFIDFTLTTTGISGAAISSITGSGSAYNVTLYAGSGTGTIRLNLVDDDSIMDTSNHRLGGTGSGNGNFAGESYSMIRPENVRVTIGTDIKGSYTLYASENKRDTYTATNAGPVQVNSLDTVPILASERVLAGGKSYSEMMGYPDHQLTNEYIFPFYNNLDFDSQLRVGNLGDVDTEIKVYLGSSPDPIETFILGSKAATRRNYALRDGPMRVTSSTTNILTTLRAWVNNASYSELTGFPANQLTNEYLYPYYNNVDFNSQLRVSNLGATSTTIKVYLGSNPDPIDTFPLAPGAATRVNYAGRRDGPMRVTSTSTNILTTIRAYVSDATGTKYSYSELMGFPADQKTNEYWYPYYDDVTLDSQLRVSNIGTGTTHITVYAAGNQIDSYDLPAGQASRKRYGITTGPLHIVSSTQPILTTIRLWYTAGGFPSYYEVTGLPKSQLSSKYWFPWYNNVNLSTDISVAKP